MDTIKGAADEVLAILKMERFNDRQRKEEIEGLLDKMSDETFNEMTIIAQNLIDYNSEETGFGQHKHGGGMQGENIEVNVEFDKEEESDEGPEGGEESGGD